jgi:hypothetical protein
MPNKVWWQRGIGIIVGLFWLLAACYAQTPPSLVPTTPALTKPVPTSTCYPKPEPTGEKVIRPTLEATPPAQVSPGQSFTVTFSGNYLIANNAIICGDTLVKHAYSDELPTFNWNRTVRVALDERTLTTVACGRTCQIEATIPKDSQTGAHTLILETNWERITFDLQIVKP